MTEFEELALKRISKEYLIECIYNRINLTASQFGISNAEISKYIGWDSAGYNQKYNRSNDLRITTFIKIYVALCDLISVKEKESGLSELGNSEINLSTLITKREVRAGALFNHISAAAEGRCEFLSVKEHVETFLEMKPFVLMSKRNNKINDRIVSVYVEYYKKLIKAQEL